MQDDTYLQNIKTISQESQLKFDKPAAPALLYGSETWIKEHKNLGKLKKEKGDI